MSASLRPRQSGVDINSREGAGFGCCGPPDIDKYGVGGAIGCCSELPKVGGGHGSGEATRVGKGSGGGGFGSNCPGLLETGRFERGGGAALGCMGFPEIGGDEE